MKDYDETEIIKELKIDARAVGIPEGAAEAFIERTMKEVKKALKNHSIITEKDLNRTILKELKKYNADLAYVYENRDKII
jgi:transcriptional regulator NrdR family protein